MRRTQQRGFSLLDLVVALMIGAFALVTAAKIATWATQRGGQGQQENELASRTRLLGVQLRTDLALAGYGSTAAIGCSATFQGLAGFCVASAGGNPAVPAVRGVDNNPAGQVLDGTDVIQVVVPDPSTTQVTTQPWSRNTPMAFVTPFLPNCQAVYVLDHSAPNGAGRVQLLPLRLPGRNQTDDSLLVDVYPGSEVMCARVSVYWVDPSRTLRRSDLDTNDPATFQVGASGIYVTPAPGQDEVSPGVEDFQVAYAFSSMINDTPDQRWAFDGAMGTAETALGAANQTWFEVRQVRYNLLVRSLRRVADTQATAQTLLENRAAPPVQLATSYGRHVLTGAQELTNFRFFDEGAVEGLAPEPF